MAYFNHFVANLSDALRLIRFDRVAAVSVASRAVATKFGVFFLTLPVVVNLLLSSFLFPSGFSAIFSRFLLWPLVIPVLALVAMVFAIVFVAEKFFGSHAGYLEMFRVASYAAVFAWLGILPFFLDVIGISIGYGVFNLLWFVAVALVLAVVYFYLVQNTGLKKENAVVCLVAGVVVYFVAQLLLGEVLVGASYRILY